MMGFLAVMVIALVLCQWIGSMMMPLCPRVRDGFEDFDLLENVHAVEALRGDGEGRRRTTGGFMVGSGASPADAAAEEGASS